MKPVFLKSSPCVLCSGFTQTSTPGFLSSLPPVRCSADAHSQVSLHVQQRYCRLAGHGQGCQLSVVWLPYHIAGRLRAQPVSLPDAA